MNNKIKTLSIGTFAGLSVLALTFSVASCGASYKTIDSYLNANKQLTKTVKDFSAKQQNDPAIIDFIKQNITPRTVYNSLIFMQANDLSVDVKVNKLTNHLADLDVTDKEDDSTFHYVYEFTKTQVVVTKTNPINPSDTASFKKHTYTFENNNFTSSGIEGTVSYTGEIINPTRGYTESYQAIDIAKVLEFDGAHFGILYLAPTD
jgi:hypothetical protein